MTNAFGALLYAFHQKKDEVTADMTNDLLRKHPDFPPDKVLVQEAQFPTGKYIIKVSLRDGFDEIDYQTATLTPSIEARIIRTVALPDYHPDYEKNEKNKKLQEDW